MADVLALDAFARSHYHHHTIPLVPAPNAKVATGGPVYYRQHEVIQLVEVPAPPPAAHPSTITASSMPSSSAYTESCDSEGSESDEEDESAVSSYCSSDEGDDAARGYYDDTYGTRIKRVLAWRDHHAKAVAYSMEHPSQHSASLSKRKYETSLMSLPQKQAKSHRSLSFHSCSACDSDFPTKQSLREHARVSSSSEACRAAVEYGFES